MNCPRCQVATELRDHDGVKVNECKNCAGMFLHRGELNKIALSTQGDLEFSTLHEESFSHSDWYEPIACPDCGNDPMQKVEFNIYTGIVLDYCSSCEGFWLDGTELDRINDEVRALDEAAESGPDTGMLWFARFIWTLPK